MPSGRNSRMIQDLEGPWEKAYAVREQKRGKVYRMSDENSIKDNQGWTYLLRRKRTLGYE
jgi:hypothetical protein